MIVKWDRPPHELHYDAAIFQASGLVFNATYLNPIQQAHHWHTQRTIKTFVRVQHVIAENIALQKSSLSIKLPNNCNYRETVQKRVNEVALSLAQKSSV